MEITASSMRELDIRNIAYPQLIRPAWHISFYQVLPLVETMIRFGRMARLRTFQFKAFALQKRIECISAYHALAKDRAAHEPKFLLPDSGIFLTDRTDKLGYWSLTFTAILKRLFLLIISLSAMAKQLASGTY